MGGLVTLKPAAFPPFESDDPLLLVNVACDTQAEMTAAGFTFPEPSPAVTCVAGSGFKFDQVAQINITTAFSAAIAADFSVNGTVAFKISRHCLENLAGTFDVNPSFNVWASDRAFTQTGGMFICSVYNLATAASITRLYNNNPGSTQWIFRHEADVNTVVLSFPTHTSDGYSTYYDPEYAHVVVSWSGKTGHVYFDGHLMSQLAYTDALTLVRNIVGFGSATICPHDSGASDDDPVYLKDIQISLRPVINSGDRRPGLRVAFFGDSTMERGGNKAASVRPYGFMEDISGRFRALGLHAHYFNHGHSGHYWSVSRGANNLRADIAAMLADKPDIVVACMTLNDVNPKPLPSDLQSSLETDLATINADPNVRKILLCSNVPFTQGASATNAFAAGATQDAVAIQDEQNVIFHALTLPSKCERLDMWTLLGGHDAPAEYSEGSRGFDAPNATQLHQTRLCQFAQANLIFKRLLEYVNGFAS